MRLCFPLLDLSWPPVSVYTCYEGAVGGLVCTAYSLEGKLIHITWSNCSDLSTTMPLMRSYLFRVFVGKMHALIPPSKFFLWRKELCGYGLSRWKLDPKARTQSQKGTARVIVPARGVLESRPRFKASIIHSVIPPRLYNSIHNKLCSLVRTWLNMRLPCPGVSSNWSLAIDLLRGTLLDLLLRGQLANTTFKEDSLYFSQAVIYSQHHSVLACF